MLLRRQQCFRKIRTKHQILAKSLAGVEYDVYIENYRLQELDKALQSFTLRLVDEFCHANNKQVIMRSCSYMQLGINSTRDVWKFWQNLQTSLVLSIPNCTRPTHDYLY